MYLVIICERENITKNRACFLKRNSVLTKVARFLLRVPFKFYLWHSESTAFRLSRHVAPHIQQQIDAGPQRISSFVLAGTYHLIAIAVVCLKLFFLRFRADDDRFGGRDDLLVVADAFVIAKVPWQRPVIGRYD